MMIINNKFKMQKKHMLIEQQEDRKETKKQITTDLLLKLCAFGVVDGDNCLTISSDSRSDLIDIKAYLIK